MKEAAVIEAHHHQKHQQPQPDHHKEEEQTKKRGCRPIAFLLGFPFAICGLCLTLAGGIVWILGSMLSYVCPCLSCCADLANSSMNVIKSPISISRWFIDKIPF